MQNIRNFVIIAHIDHGKSTLADRFLELTGSVEKRKMHDQLLDTMDLERERGITIKMTPARMIWKDLVLNLIDTPGHVDFSYEVSRALAAVEGAILLVDATKGVQAQTLAHLRVAHDLGLAVVPAINKIDLSHARADEVEQEIIDAFSALDMMPDRIYRISAKTGEGTEALLAALVDSVPPPTAGGEKLQALVFDSVYDAYKGVVVHARLFGGAVSAREHILSMASGKESIVGEVGIFTPAPKPSHALTDGSIGYIATGLKDINLVHIGDTITHAQSALRAPRALSGYQEPVPVVFASFYPSGDDTYEDLRDALAHLKLNDAALSFEGEYSEALGRGWKCGFLGMLHMEIVLERLRREYHLELIVTTPSVAYEVHTKNGNIQEIHTPSKFPDAASIEKVFEPWIELEIIVPSAYMGGVLRLLKDTRGEQGDTDSLGRDILRIHYRVPLAEIITNFYDRLKSISQGYASLSYRLIEAREGEVVKLDILLAGQPQEALASIVPKGEAEKRGRALVEKIKDVLPGENFAVAIQAAIGGRVVARETRSAYRKDVTAGLYGGDYTRKRKQLEKQKKGKARLKEWGRVHLDAETFMKIFK